VEALFVHRLIPNRKGRKMGELRFVKNFPNRAFAEQAKDILEKQDIGCVLKSPDIGILGISSTATFNGVDLYVDERDFEKAQQALNALFNGI
jgi:hypothetical protein